MKTINPYRLFVGAWCPNWLMEQTEVSAGAKLCYARLCQYAGKDGLAFPAQDTLAQTLGVGGRQVRRYIEELIRLKLIHIERRGLNQTNTYTFLDHPWIAGQDRTHMTGQDRSDTADRRESVKRSSSSEELRSSSSSSEEEEDREHFLKLIEARYRPSFFTKDYPGLRSPIKAPGPYFKKLRENGDAPASFGVVSTIEACQLIRDALVMDFPEGSSKRKERFTIPMPTDIGGMTEILQMIKLHSSSRGTIRRAVFNFVRFDEDNPEGEIDPTKLLTSLSRAPERFVTALENVSRED